MKGFFEWLKPSAKMKRWIFTILIGVILSCYGLAEVIVMKELLFSEVLKVIILFVTGFTLIVIGIVSMQKRTLEILIEASDERMQNKKNINLKSLIFNKKIYSEGPNIVVIGGGTGLNTVIRGLRKYTNNITAIVTVSAYGKLPSTSRKDLNMLPLDDIKESVIALSENEEILGKLLNIEFKSGKLRDLSFSDIYFNAMKKISSNFSDSIENSNKIFNIVGKVLPVTLDEIKICAELENGMVIEDKDEIPEVVTDKVTKINRVYISPTNCRTTPEVIEAIKNADCIVIGPGSLYTNVIPNLLVNGVVKAIKESKAIKTYICNIMTEPGQTDNYGVSDHVNAIIEHAGQDIIDYCVYDTGEVVPEYIKKYNLEGSDLVEQDIQKVKNKGIQLIQRNLSAIGDEDRIRHNPDAIASAIIDLICDDLKYKDKQDDPQYLMLKAKNDYEKKINKIKKSNKNKKPSKEKNEKGKTSKFVSRYGNRIESIKNTDRIKSENMRIMKEADKLEAEERAEFLKSVNMEEKISLEEGLSKEWIITNGIGGFASSTILGANTRKYHGLLIAPLTPPARRFLVLSKVDESMEIEGKEYILYTNVCEKYISDGHKNLEYFEKEYVPKFVYKVGDTIVEKTICMQYGKNTVGVLYKIENGDYNAKLKLTPLVNFRDFHTMNTNHEYKVNQTVNNKKVKIVVDGESRYPLYMNCSEGTYIKYENNNFKNMFYIEEQKRGFYPEEDHNVVGSYEIELKAKEIKEISFVFSLEENIEEIDVKKVILNEKVRLNKVIKNSELLLNTENIESKKDKKIIEEKNEIIKELIIATDSFIAYRPSFGLNTILAGYPWFLDWGRDSLIAFEGLLLKTKRYDIAREVLLTFTKDIKFGLVPNGYSGYDNRPLYNSVDSSLLLFEQLNKYIEYTGDYTFVEKNFYRELVKVIESYKDGIDVDNNNIYMDKDYLINSGTENTQNTWMDAKVNGIAVTPRNGKAVEINSMWYNCLMIMGDFTKRFKTEEKAKHYYECAENVKKSFNKKFYNKEKKCLFDVLGDNKVRPNQLFSLSLSYPVIDPNSKKAEEIMQTVTDKLYNKYGLKSLEKGQPNYIEIYEGDSFKRDMSYHQGITWTWLFGLYYNSYKNMINASKTESRRKKLQTECEKFKENVYKTFKKEVKDIGCLGSISELYDSKAPHLPKGAISQAWSVSEILRIILEQ